MRLRGLALIACMAACGRDLGPPRNSPRPEPSTRAPLLGPAALSPRIANYQIAARYDVPSHVIEGDMTLTWRNAGTAAVDRLPFHLYLNAFRDNQSVFFRENGGQLRGDAASPASRGSIVVLRLTVNDRDVTARIAFPGPDDTVMQVDLPEPILPGEVATITARFTSTLPEVFARSGYKDAFTLAGQWFPKIGVRLPADKSRDAAEDQWVCDPYHGFGEFFSDFGTYDVSLTLPQSYVVAATGILISALDHVDGTRTHTFRAEDVHDFAWMADPYMLTLKGAARNALGTVDVMVLYRPAQRHFALRHLDAATRAIEVLSELLVPYPWSSMTVVVPPLDASGAAGMEYQTFVTTAGDHALMRPGIRVPEMVTIHEVAHNWFQGMLASNENEAPWLDEGITEWATAHVMERLYGPGKSLFDIGPWRGDLPRFQSALLDDANTMAAITTPASGFFDSGIYGAVVYAKAMLALRTVEQLLGSDLFLAGMKEYAERWQFRHPTARDLEQALESKTGSLAWIWPQVMNSVGGIELALLDADARSCQGDREHGYECAFVVASAGEIHAPVEVLLRFTDGSQEVLVWDVRGGERWKRFSIKRSMPITEIELDPNRNLELLTNATFRRKRMFPQHRASIRAGARVAYWAAWLMGTVGL